MKKIDWVRKLTSRKLWIALAGLVSGIIIACTGNEETAQMVSGIIMAAASVVGYLIGEGLADSGSHDTYVVDDTVNVDEEEDGR